MIRPPPRASMLGTASWARVNGACRLTAKWCSQSSRGISSSGADQLKPTVTAALLTRMSTPANRSMAVPTICARSRSSDRSAATATASPPRDSISLTVCPMVPGSSLPDASTVRAGASSRPPLRASARAARLPIPRLEPVTIATLPARLASFCRSMSSPSRCRSAGRLDEWERREGEVPPQQPRPLLGIGGDGRDLVENLRQTVLRVIRGPARVAGRGERRPRRAEPGGGGVGLLGGVRAEQQRAKAVPEGSEQKRQVEAVARAEQAARARCLPRDLVEVGPAAACRLRLGQLQGGHPEDPVGLHLPVQLLGGRFGEGGAVLFSVLAGAEDRQRPRGLLRRDAAGPAAHDQEQAA